MAPLTRSRSKVVEPKAATDLPADLISVVLANVAHVHAFAFDAGKTLHCCALINSNWRLVAINEATWKKMCMRVAPTSPFMMDVDERAYICSPLTDPMANSLLHSSSMPFSYRDFYWHRVHAGLVARDAYRPSGFSCMNVDLNWSGMPCFMCTRKIVPPAPAPFAYEDLVFMIEIFETDSARRRRERWHQMDDEGEACDFINSDALARFASAPHFACRSDREKEENLVWSTTVRGERESMRVCAVVPRDDQDAIERRYTLPVDTYMDDYHSCW